MDVITIIFLLILQFSDIQQTQWVTIYVRYN